jgi:hypothetical protein
LPGCAKQPGTDELAGFGAVAEIDRDLLERNYGEYEGRLTADIHRERPEWQLFRDGCPGGEAPNAVGTRADRVVKRVRAVGGDVLLFSSGHFLRVFAARWLGLDAVIGSVASVFVSRWDAAVASKVPAALNNQLGIALAKRTYKAYRDLLGSPRWQRIYNARARPQRLLWASTGTKDPQAADVLYIKALAAPFTVNTMPEGTLKALADQEVCYA